MKELIQRLLKRNEDGSLCEITEADQLAAASALEAAQPAKKPPECATTCPENQVCDYCQAAQPKEQFCFCNDDISLQIVTGGGAPEGLYGSVTLKVGGEYVKYVRATAAQPAGETVATLFRGGDFCYVKGAKPADFDPEWDECWRLQVESAAHKLPAGEHKLYTHPAPQVPMTEVGMAILCVEHIPLKIEDLRMSGLVEYTRAVEAHHGVKP